MDAASVKRRVGISVLQRVYYNARSYYAHVVEFFESPTIPFFSVLMTFVFCVLIRDYIESFSQLNGNYLNIVPLKLFAEYSHFNAFYLSSILILALLLHVVTSEKMEKVLRLFMSCSFVLVLGPLLDLLLSGGAGHSMHYMMVDEYHNLFAAFFSYTGDYDGISPGMRVETALIYVSIFAYSRLKGCDLITSFFASFLSYTIMFIYGATPFVIKLIYDAFGLDYSYSSYNCLRYFMVINFFLIFAIAYRVDKKIFMAIFNEMPWLRMAYYQLMLFFGLSYALSDSFFTATDQLTLRPDIGINWFIQSLSLFFALMFAMMINNISDVEIDKVSNKHRVLVSGILDAQIYERIAYACFFLSLCYATLIGTQALMASVVLMGAYYIYSVYPLRLKRIPVVSKLVVSFCSLVLMVQGWWLVKISVTGFPVELGMIMLIGATLVANFIDLKDVSGDRCGKIKTIPILLGDKWTRLLIAIATVATYMALAAFLQGKFITILLTFACILQCYILAQKDYSEKTFLVIKNIGLLSISLYLLA